jgi:hypothetical protein
MIDIALLDAIDALPADDAAQAHAKQWAQRVRELRKRQDELLKRQVELLDAADAAAAEFNDVSVELLRLCHSQMDMIARLRPSTGTMQ